MLVSTSGFQLVHSGGGGVKVKGAPVNPGTSDHTGTENGINDNKNNKNLQSDNLPPPAEESRVQTPKLKKNKHSTTLSFLYPTSSSKATLIVEQDQYIFIVF